MGPTAGGIPCVHRFHLISRLGANSRGVPGSSSSSSLNSRQSKDLLPAIHNEDTVRHGARSNPPSVPPDSPVGAHDAH